MELSQAYGRLDVHRARAPDLGNSSVRDAVLTASLGTEAAVMARRPRRYAPIRTSAGSSTACSTVCVRCRALRQSDGSYLHRLLIEQRSFEQLLAFRFG